MTTKTIELAKKLAELAKRGIDGEKINAEKALQRIMEKYGITLEDIEEDKMFNCYFKYTDKTMFKLLIQVVYSVIGQDYKAFRHGRGTIRVIATTSQRIEIEIKYDAYKRAYKKQVSLFYDAFINKNHIFHESCEGRDFDTLTQAELDHIRAVKRMMQGIESTEVRRQLKSA